APKPQALGPAPGAGGAGKSLEEFARKANSKPEELGEIRRGEVKKQLDAEAKGEGDGKGDKDRARLASEAQNKLDAYTQAKGALEQRRLADVQSGKLGVDWSCYNCNLRTQSRLDQSAQRNVYGRNCLEVGGVWIDEGFGPKTEAVVVKAQSNAYFRILEKQPQVKDVYRLGNHVVWMTPSGKALVIDGANGKDELDDKEIDQLFTAKK